METEIRVVGGGELIAAKAVEKQVFLDEKYPYDYDHLDAQSIMLGAFLEGECVGALRLIAQSPVAPPVLADCRVWDPHIWQQLGGRFEEVGTVAVPKQHQHRGVGYSLYASAYGNAKARGVTHWGIVMEPERVDFFNTSLFFTFQQVGEIGYKGWDCAPYVMDVRAGIRNIHRHDPAMYELVQSYILEEYRDDLA